MHVLAVTEKQQEKVQGCEKQPGKNNFGGFIRVDKRKWMK